jgi:hypothetical protein
MVLTEEMRDAIAAAARPLQPAERRQFLADLLEELLHSRAEIGDGSLARLLRDLQRRYFKPPEVKEMTEAGYRPGPKTTWAPTNWNAVAAKR